MKMLAVDSSGLVASVALLTENTIVAEYNVNYKKTHSQTLMPMLDTIMKMVDISLEEIDYIAISEGPGSFTGLRIGSATVKGLGFALNKPIVSVPTLEGLAMNLYGVEDYICPIMDARRNQVYTGVYCFLDGKLAVVQEQAPMDMQELIAKLNDMQKSVIFVGDGIPVYQEQLANDLTVPYTLAPAHLNRQRAAAVGMRAWDYVAEGRIQTATEHVPEYLRLSQAEREYAEKHKS